MDRNRRLFLRTSLAAAAGLATTITLDAGGQHPRRQGSTQERKLLNGAGKLSIFSKNLHWLEYNEMADVAAGLGFDGIDLTVRPAGHVLPERVATDLPRAVEAIRKAGLSVYMITTAITDAHAPHTAAILKTAGALGIGQYRTGWYTYDNKRSVEEQLGEITAKLRDLAALSAEHNIVVSYQNHSGEYFGAPVWDLYGVLRQINSPWIRSQYDIMHATVEGANAWPMGLELIKPYIGSIDIKDFIWEKKDGKWTAEVVPLGQGMIDFKRFFGLVAQNGLKVPVSVHYEYPLGGVEHGAKKLTIGREEVLRAMKGDCERLKQMLRP